MDVPAAPASDVRVLSARGTNMLTSAAIAHLHRMQTKAMSAPARTAERYSLSDTSKMHYVRKGASEML